MEKDDPRWLTLPPSLRGEAKEIEDGLFLVDADSRTETAGLRMILLGFFSTLAAQAHDPDPLAGGTSMVTGFVAALELAGKYPEYAMALRHALIDEDKDDEWNAQVGTLADAVYYSISFTEEEAIQKRAEGTPWDREQAAPPC